MLFQPTGRITKEFLLENQSQETYLQYYLDIPVKKGLFKSPLRKDNNPTCSFYLNKSGDIIFKDFAGNFSGNFIAVVMEQYNCSYYKALQIIANDFGLITNKNLKKSKKPIEIIKEVFTEKSFCNIQVQIQPFLSSELKWWAQYGITEHILEHFKVYSCRTVFLNEEIFSFSNSQNPTYGYYRGINEDKFELWRIYFPMKKEYRFLSNWSSSMIQGGKQLNQYGTNLVITKSLKDVMCLYSFGISAIAPNSEHLFITEKQFEKLSTRYKNIYLLYDNDYTGIQNMNKIRKKFNIKCLWIPRSYKAKDISDFYKMYKQEETLKLINLCRKNQNSE